jgi:uncharacterized circularly permuted ATP-grasp superfamily protein
VAGIFNAFRAGGVAVTNAVGTGVADDKASPCRSSVLHGREPISRTSTPGCCTAARSRRARSLDEVVVKAVGESGLRDADRPAEHRGEREEFRHRIEADPRNYIAQPTLALSRAPCFIEDQVQARRRPAPVHPVRRPRHDRAGRPDALALRKGRSS